MSRSPKTRHSWAWVGDFEIVAAGPLPFSDRLAERSARLPMGRSVGWVLWKEGLRSKIERQPAVVQFSANFTRAIVPRKGIAEKYGEVSQWRSMGY